MINKKVFTFLIAIVLFQSNNQANAFNMDCYGVGNFAGMTENLLFYINITAADASAYGWQTWTVPAYVENPPGERGWAPTIQYDQATPSGALTYTIYWLSGISLDISEWGSGQLQPTEYNANPNSPGSYNCPYANALGYTIVP